MTDPTYTRAARSCLERLLVELAPVKIAVSGGVDSMTLALVAARVLGAEARMFHARSPAVPDAASARVRSIGEREGWNLQMVDAGEFDDDDYRQNPYRRCFHCKKNLYATLAEAGPGQILSGTNADDLKDFRPGLEAAERYTVRHPFVECGIDKAGIRRICASLGFDALAALPASPCLSSRVETGLRIEPDVLELVDRIEAGLRAAIRPAVVRCRVRRRDTERGLVVELDAASLAAFAPAEQARWAGRIAAQAKPLGLSGEVRFETYSMGSAFVAAEPVD